MNSTGLNYQGSKRSLVDWMFDRMPRGDCFVDLCGGGAAVTIAALRSKAYGAVVYNDINSELVNFFRQTRDRGEELAELIDITPYSREEFDLSKTEVDDDMEMARRFYVMQMQSFRALGQGGSGMWQTSKTDSFAYKWMKIPHKLLALAHAVKGAQIENRDVNDCINIYDAEETIFYADPPYVPESMTGKSSYTHDMTVEDHEKMAESLRDAKGNAVVSGYPSELYNRLFNGWERHDRKHQTSLGAVGKKERTECIWIKRPASDTQTDLFI